MYKTIAAIAGIVIIECVALFKGINGTGFYLSACIIGGLGGYAIRNLKNMK